jgi:hypothetical protein
VNTSPCPGWPNTGGCTSGSGYNVLGNTGADGTYSQDIPYSCVQQVDPINVTANGYNPTVVSYTSGTITGDVGIPTIYLTPNGNVPETNQGVGGTAATGSQLGIEGWFRAHDEAVEIVIGVIIAVIALIVIIGAIRGG